MADMRRRSAEPPPGPPHVQLTPGLANEMLHELAPLLAEDGTDVDAIDVPDLDTLHRALTRAVERRNRHLFSPVGAARDVALGTLRRVVEAILDRTPPSPEPSSIRLGRSRRTTRSPPSPAASASHWGCSTIGSPGGAGNAPTRLGQHTCLPAGHWTGERAATDIVALARKGPAFRSLDKLLTRQGGPQVLAGSTLALAAATRAWAQLSDSPPADLIRTTIR